MELILTLVLYHFIGFERRKIMVPWLESLKLFVYEHVNVLNLFSWRLAIILILHLISKGINKWEGEGSKSEKDLDCLLFIIREGGVATVHWSCTHRNEELALLQRAQIVKSTIHTGSIIFSTAVLHRQAANQKHCWCIVWRKKVEELLRFWILLHIEANSVLKIASFSSLVHNYLIFFRGGLRQKVGQERQKGFKVVNFWLLDADPFKFHLGICCLHCLMLWVRSILWREVVV